MIAGSLLVAVLVGRELFRATDPDGRGARILGTLLPLVAGGFAVVAMIRFAGLVVAGA